MNSEHSGGTDDRIWVVDRIESGIAVMVRDGDAYQMDVPAAVLPAGIGEGAVLRVPAVRGRPIWNHAVADEEMRVERLRQADDVLQRLRRRDPGGDVVL